MVTGSRSIAAIIVLGVLFAGSSPAASVTGTIGKIGKPKNNALGRFISSKSDIGGLVSSGIVPGAELVSATQITGWSTVGEWPTPQGVLSDTLSLLVDMVSEIWDDFGSAWMNEAHTSHTYDPEGRKVQTVMQNWFMNNWQYTGQINYQYDGIGILRKVLGRGWNGGTWVDNTDDTLSYDEYGRVVREFLRLYSGSSWQNFIQYFISYDSGGRQTGLRKESWNGSAWQNEEHYSLTYTPEGKISELVYQTWGGTDWVNNLRDSYSYDVSGNQIEELNQYWSGGMWKDDARYLSTFDIDNLLVEVVQQLWVTSAWENESRQSLNNDMDGHPTEILIQYWDGVAWSNDAILYHTYDGPNIVEDYYVVWDGFAWVGRHKVSYTWQTVVTPDEITQKYPVSAAWNLVSVPLDVVDYSKTTLFPTSVSSAFYFDAGYSAAPVLENGKGYWLKFDSLQAVPITGTRLTTDTVDVTAGWNLVGSISEFIPASGVGSIPGGLVVSSFFGFNAGYSASAIIEPGKAYWVKVAEAGKLIFSSSTVVPAASRVKILLPDDRPPAPPADAVASPAIPAENALAQNYPNPFNPATEITFTLRDAGYVKLAVYNIIGREVAVLVDGVREAGEQTVRFDGEAFPSGVYFYTLSTPSFSGTKRMVLLK